MASIEVSLWLMSWLFTLILVSLLLVTSRLIASSQILFNFGLALLTGSGSIVTHILILVICCDAFGS